MKNISITKDRISIENTYFKSICSSLSSGAMFIMFKAILYFMDNNVSANTIQLKKLSSMSENTFRLYLRELVRKRIIELTRQSTPVGGYISHIAFLIQDDSSNIPNRMLYKIGQVQKKDNRNNNWKNIALKREIIIPFMKEARKRGKEDAIPEGNLYAKLNHIKNEFVDKLSYKDILNILIIALDDKFLNKIGKSTDIFSAFLGRTSLVEKYLSQGILQGAFYIQDDKGNIVSPLEFGYFIKDDLKRYIHQPPNNKKTMYHIVSKEIYNRFAVKDKDETLDKYFDKNGKILDRYKWMIGSAGDNHKFVRKE